MPLQWRNQFWQFGGRVPESETLRSLCPCNCQYHSADVGRDTVTPVTVSTTADVGRDTVTPVTASTTLLMLAVIL